MSFAFVFPGQGSQSIGMMASLAEAEPVVRETFAEASEVLSYDLWRLIQDGPKERLDATECTQPAMLAAGTATWRLWLHRGGVEPAVVSGHSLGEFTALVCAGALEFAGAVDLVRFRGQVMQEAIAVGAGSMAAILGLEDGDVEAACREAAQGGVVEAVNFDSPGQVVIAGDSGAVLRAIEAAKARGAKRSVLLPVSVPSHCSLMRGAGERLGERLSKTPIHAPRIRYLSPVDVRYHETPEDIRRHLTGQLSRPVQWTATVRAMLAERLDPIFECGPGKVLTGLNRRVERGSSAEFLALEDLAAIEAGVARSQGRPTGNE